MNTIKKLGWLVCVVIFLFSCKTEDKLPIIENGAASVIMKISASEGDNLGNLIPSKASNQVNQQNVATTDQILHVPFNEKYIMEVQVSKQSRYKVNEFKAASTQVDALGDNKAALQVYNLDPGTQYRMVVYLSNNTYVSQIVCKVGEEEASPLKLNAGEQYTFVLLSYNSKTNVPDAVGTNSLSSQNFSVAPAPDFMYVKVPNVTLVAGTNYLNAKFQHKVCQITTTIDATDVGTITAYNNINISTHYSNASLNLSTGALTAYSGSPIKYFDFGALSGSKIITSIPKMIFAPNTTNATLTLGSLTIAGTTKTGVTVSGISLQTGQRYNLIVKVKNPFELTDGLIWAPGNLLYTAAPGNPLNGTWSFAGLTQVGSYFPGALNAVKRFPANLVINANGDLLDYNSNPSDDPCAQVPAAVSGKPWRTPTRSELLALNSKPFAFVTKSGVSGGEYNGVAFFPYSGYFRTIYKTFVGVNMSAYYLGTNWDHLFFGASSGSGYTSVPVNGWNQVSYPGDYQNGMTIRCVRNK